MKSLKNYKYLVQIKKQKAKKKTKEENKKKIKFEN